MQQAKLPFTWKNIHDWHVARHYQPAEAYTAADRVWKALASMILEEMSDAEVEQMANALSAEHGTYNDGRMEMPDITDRDFPAAKLESRLHLIARRKKFAKDHQKPGYRLMDQHHMAALYVHEYNGEWHWEVIHESLVDAFGREKMEGAAWTKAEEQWRISQARLTQKGVQS